jgi:predicted RNA-binding Zn-ribbon protein involved in translation (DUF1610 family)
VRYNRAIAGAVQDFLGGLAGVTRKNAVMLCEICKGLAVDRTPPGSEGVKINCPTCGNYAIAGDVLNKFRELTVEERRRALQKAKARVSLGRPLITRTEL